MRRRLFGLATAFTLLAVIGIVVLNGPAQAAPGDAGTNFYAYLNGNAEVPPTASDTTGMAAFHVNGDGTMSYTVTVYNILNPMMGHIHLGAPGVAGPIVADLIPMGAPNSGRQNILASGTITAATLSGPLKGQPLSVLVNQMAYNTYVNIHTSNGTSTLAIGNYPAGEIRGNIISADANRIGTQPAVPAMVNVPTTGGATFPFPAVYAPPVVAPVTGAAPAGGVSSGSTSAGSAQNSPSGQTASNPSGAGGSTSGAASGAPTTGGSGSTTSNPTGGGAGSSGTGAVSGPLGAGAAISSGGTTGATSGSTTSSSSGSGTGGAGTVAKP